MTGITTDRRFTVPMYSVSEASRYLRLPRQTLVNWADGYSTGGAAPVAGASLVTAIPSKGERSQPRLPFIGVAEAYVLNVFRRAGVPMQRIRPSLDVLKDELGPHALASNRLFSDGAEVLWNLGAHALQGTPEQVSVMRLLVPRSGQYVFNEVVANYLQRIAFSDGYARLIRLENYGEAEVVLDPDRGYGHPIFAKAGVLVDNVLGAIRAGDSLEETAEDYGLPVAELRDALSLSA